MEEYTVFVDKHKIICDGKLLATYFGRKPGTIRTWIHSDKMPVEYTADSGTNMFDLMGSCDWKKINK